MPRFPASPHRRVRTPLLLQPEPLGCGPAALWIMLGYFGKFVPLEELRETLSAARDGTRLTHLLRAARHYGLQAKAYRKAIADLPQFKPPFLLYWGFNHYVIVEGFGQDEIYLNDPAVGRRAVTHDELNLRFTGIVAVLQPGHDFQTGGKRASGWTLLRQRCRGLEVSLVSQAGLSLLVPLPALLVFGLLRAFIDDYLKGQSMMAPSVLWGGLWMAAIFQATLTSLQQTALARRETQLTTAWSHHCCWKLLRLPLTYHVQRGSDAPLELVRSNETIAQFLIGDASRGIAHIATLCCCGALMLWWSPILAGVGLGGAALIGVALWANDAVQRERAGRLSGESARLAGSQLAVLADLEAVQLSGAADNAFIRITGLQARLLNAKAALGLRPDALATLPNFLSRLALALMLTVGTIEVIQDNLSIGTLVIFQGLLPFFLASVEPLLRLALRLRSIGQGLADLDYVERYPTPTEPSAERPPKIAQPPQGRLELKAITFGYSTLYPPVIENLNLTLAPGQRVALVGANGSGKSTVGKLIGRLYTPWSGEILIDERAIPAPNAEPQAVGLVTGDSFFIEGTLRENLRLGDMNISQANLDTALRDACLEELLSRHSGWDTFIAAEGANLSGGQRQRLAVARILARQPALLVLDEATNALDPVTEHQLHHNLRQRGCAYLIISHRLSALRDCDEVVVLEKGAIVQRGSHEQLAIQDGVYRSLLQGGMARNEKAGFTLNAVTPDAIGSELIEPAGVAQNAAAPGPQHEHLLATCRLIGAQLGLTINAASDATLSEIAQASNFRVRPLQLKSQWWQQPSGPLLLSDKAGRPLALLAVGGRYEIRDVVSALSRPLTAESARAIAPQAWMFYPALPDRWRSLEDLLPRLRVRDVATLMLLTSLEGLLLLLPCLAVGIVVGVIIPSGDAWGALWLGLMLGAGAVIGLSFSLVRQVALMRLETRLDSFILAAVWDRLLRSPARLFRCYSATQLYEQISVIQSSIIDCAASSTGLLASGLAVFLCVGVICCFQPRLALVALLLMLPHLISARREASAHESQAERLEQAFSEEAATASLMLSGLPVLRLLGQADFAFARWRDKFAYRQQLVADARQSANRYGLFETAWSLLAPGPFLAFAATAHLRPEVLLLLLVIFWQLQAATKKWRDSWLQRAGQQATLQHAAPLLQTVPMTTHGQISPGRLKGKIEWRQISFRYAENLPFVLDKFTLKVNAGEFIGIVGASGAGKSTLLRLALGLEALDDGAMLYDGKALTDLDLTLLRQQMGIMLQTSKLVAGDIKSNILGALPLPLERAWDAARLIGLEEDIRRLPMGMKTFVAEGGSNFSAAQQQLLLLARALVHQPAIVFLDEAAGHLDNARDNYLARVLESLTMTRIVIAHRYSTIRHADRIIVLADGRMAQSGTYEELMAEAGHFRELAARQQVT